MRNINQLQDNVASLGDLLEERKQRMLYDHYMQQEQYLPGERIRAPLGKDGKKLRKGALIVANCIAVPVRYGDNFNPTHVLCWVPQTDTARWLCLKDWRFKMKDLNGIPEHLHFDVTKWQYGDK